MTKNTPRLRRFLKLLELNQLDRDMFIGDPGKGEGRLFGGLVAAQSVVAAHRTVEEGVLHSLHAYFLRPGSHDVPIRFVVYRIRDGRTFTTRDVVAYQSGEAIFNISCSFVKPEEGHSQQAPMPEVPGPDGLPDWEFTRRVMTDEERERWQRWRRERPVEIRSCDPVDGAPQGDTPSRRVWIRLRGELPDDTAVHAAAITYASDFGLISTAWQVHNFPLTSQGFGASLDHAIWFHYPPRFDGWLLYVSHSPVAHAARSLILGQMYTSQGEQIASVAQEGLIRVPQKLLKKRRK